MSIFHTHILSVAVFAAFAVAPFLGAMSADVSSKGVDDKAAMREELAYIDALVNANMPDFAEPVIAAAKKRWPSLGPKLKVLELQGALRLGKFDEVQKVVDGMKEKNGEYWALRLSMADAYYTRSMMPECRKIYQDFFKSVPNPGPDLLDFYVENGFKWAQICLGEKNTEEAIKVYNGLLAKPLTEERWSVIAMEEVSLLIQLAEDLTDPKQAPKRAAYLAQAEPLVNKLLWKHELIIVFGKAIALKAHIELLRGNLEKAQALVNDYMPQLAEIHKSLVEQDPDGSEGYVRMSPMPECRYLLAELLWRAVQAEAKKPQANEDMIKDSLFGAKKGSKRNGSGAYNHAINVFVNYPESTSAANAGELAEAIAKFVLARYKKEIRTNITPEQMAKVRRLQFQNAHNDYRNGDHEKAVDAYLEVLSRFPEFDESIEAVARLAECYLTLWQDEKDAAKKQELRLSAEAVEGYLAERFAGLKPSFVRPAGDALLSLAAKEHDLGQLGRSLQLYDLFFKNYPTHYNAAQKAYNLAYEAFKNEDWARAAHHYELVATAYTNSANYVNALQYLAVCADKMKNPSAQEGWLRKFVQASPKVSDRTTAQLQLAMMQQKQGFEAFARAAETNDAEAVEAIRKEAYKEVAGAIRDFRAVSTAIQKELETNTGYDAAAREKFNVRREQAMFLEGDGWQRLTWPEDKVSVFRAQAVKAYERYLEAFPKGKYGPVALVKMGTIFTAEKKMEESQKAFARLQSDFPESDEAKNSVPRLAKTLIEMGLRDEGVAQYRQMLATQGGKYTSGQFLAAGDALLEAKGWDVAGEAYRKSIDLLEAVTNKAAHEFILARATLGQAKASVGQRLLAEAHQKLDEFVEKNAKSQMVLEAYEMIVEVASEEGRKEKNDDLRMQYFNAAVGAIKKIRTFKKGQLDRIAGKTDAESVAEQRTLRNELDVLDLRSGEVLVRKMEAEEAMGLKEKALETCGLAAAKFQMFLMSHEPSESYPAKNMTPAQLENLEWCYSSALPLMAKLGKEQNEMILAYAGVYQELFPDGKHKTAVQNALNQAQADQ